MSSFLRKLSRQIAIYPAFPGSIIGALVPPTGYVFLVDDNGAYLTDGNGAYLVVPA